MIHEADQQWKNCFRRLLYAVELEIGGKTVGIGGFNSAWSCSRDSAEKRGKLWMGANWQSRTILAAIRKVGNDTWISIRGGSWAYGEDSRCGFRLRNIPLDRDDFVGFRVLLRPPFSTSGL